MMFFGSGAGLIGRRAAVAARLATAALAAAALVATRCRTAAVLATAAA